MKQVIEYWKKNESIILMGLFLGCYIMAWIQTLSNLGIYKSFMVMGTIHLAMLLGISFLLSVVCKAMGITAYQAVNMLNGLLIAFKANRGNK